MIDGSPDPQEMVSGWCRKRWGGEEGREDTEEKKKKREFSKMGVRRFLDKQNQ